MNIQSVSRRKLNVGLFSLLSANICVGCVKKITKVDIINQWPEKICSWSEQEYRDRVLIEVFAREVFNKAIYNILPAIDAGKKLQQNVMQGEIDLITQRVKKSQEKYDIRLYVVDERYVIDEIKIEWPLLPENYDIENDYELITNTFIDRMNIIDFQPVYIRGRVQELGGVPVAVVDERVSDILQDEMMIFGRPESEWPLPIYDELPKNARLAVIPRERFACDFFRK